MAKSKICFATLPCHPILPPPGESLHTADQATALPQVHQLLLVNSRAVYFFSDLRRHIAPPSQIVLSTGAGDLPLLYRVLQTLPTLSHYLRCIFDDEKKIWIYFFLPLRRKIAHATSHLLSMDAGFLPLLYSVLQTLPKLSHYLRCVFDYEKK